MKKIIIFLIPLVSCYAISHTKHIPTCRHCKEIIPATPMHRVTSPPQKPIKPSISHPSKEYDVISMLQFLGLTEFIKLLKEANLADQINQLQNATLLVPTNDAIQKRIGELNPSDKEIFDDNLKKILLLHVVPMHITTETIADLETKDITTKATQLDKKQVIGVHQKDNDIFFIPKYKPPQGLIGLPRIQPARVISEVIEADNNILIYKIDNMLLMPLYSFTQKDVVQPDKNGQVELKENF